MTVLELARVRWQAAGCLFFVFLFQACYSIGPVYLSHAVAGNEGRDAIRFAVIVFLFLYALPYPLSYAGFLLKVFWKTGARRAFYQTVYAKTAGRVFLAGSRDAEKSFAALVSANGQELVADCVEFVYGTASLLFSSGLSVVLISAFVLGDFLFAYGVTAILCALSVWLSRAWQMRLMTGVENAYHRMISSLPEGWFANTLGESEIVMRFMRIFDRRWRHYRKQSVSAKVAFQAYDAMMAVWIWGPTMVIVFWRLGSMDAGELIGLAIVLPRLAETLLDISNLLSNITDYLALRGRVAWLNEVLEKGLEADIKSRMHIGGLRFSRMENGEWRQCAVSSPEDAALLLDVPGRYAISGDNGAGKSSLLLFLKMRFGRQAFFLPAQAFLFPSIGRGLSTGQRKLREIQKTVDLTQGRVRLILLDEWDANLDAATRKAVSRTLDDLGCDHAVVEVSHHTERRGSGETTLSVT